MSSNLDFVQYIADQLSEAGIVTFKKMFGDYGMYCNGKIFALVCDDQLFVKITESGKRLAPDLPVVPPYDGARPYFLIEDVDNREFLTNFIIATCEELPLPTPKKRKAIHKD